MIRKTNAFKTIVMFISILLVTGMFACSAKSKVPKELTSSAVTSITKILPQGEVVYAIVCDFGSNVDASNLSKESFHIESMLGGKNESRTITKIYTNDAIATSDVEKEGKYVIIELDPADKSAGTMGWDNDAFLSSRNELKYFVTEKIAITTTDGTLFKASDKKIQNSKEVTPIVDDFKKVTYTDVSKDKLNYRFFEPKVDSSKKYPLVLFLHGAGERGNDNLLQLIANQGATVWATPEQQKQNPCYVLAPQSSSIDKLDFYWNEEPTYNTLINLVKETMAKYPIDPNRIYVVGMSMGGVGTWNIIEKNPNLFAAAVPMCGVPNSKVIKEPTNWPLYSSVDPSEVAILKNIPIWAFHGVDDPLIKVENSKEMYEAIKAAGGTLINYTELPTGTGHNSWVPALQNQDMINWLFEQRK